MKKFIKICILICMALGLVSCNDNELIEPLVKQNVVLASGFNWSTGKIVSINPFTSDVADSCNFNGHLVDPITHTDTKQDTTKYTKDTKQLKNGKCIQSVETGTSIEDASLKDALKISATPLDGTIRINGKDKDARFFVTVTALYEGSHCTTIFSGGHQLRNCINVEAYCQALKRYGLSC